MLELTTQLQALSMQYKQWRRYTKDLAGRSTALAQALAPPCLALRIALLR